MTDYPIQLSVFVPPELQEPVRVLAKREYCSVPLLFDAPLSTKLNVADSHLCLSMSLSQRRWRRRKDNSQYVQQQHMTRPARERLIRMCGGKM